MDHFPKRFEASAQQTAHLKHQPHALKAHTRRIERWLRQWHGLAGHLRALGLIISRNGCRDQMPRPRSRLYGGLVIGMVVAWITFAAGQAIECGDTLGPGGVFRLQADLDCGDVSPALTVRDGALLDLGGHTITAFGTVGVLLDGREAVLQNGTVIGPLTGISLEGSGRHTVRGIEGSAGGEGQEGIGVRSDHNQLLSNRADSSGFGFVIDGGENLLINNTGAGQGGFSVNGNANLLIKNNAPPGQFFGFFIEGDRNLLLRNNAVDVEERGFIIDGNRNRLVGNVAASSREGISVRGRRNVILRNTALNNFETDLVDSNENCDRNQWQENIFQTSRAGSVEDPACIE